MSDYKAHANVMEWLACAAINVLVAMKNIWAHEANGLSFDVVDAAAVGLQTKLAHAQRVHKKRLAGRAGKT